MSLSGLLVAAAGFAPASAAFWHILKPKAIQIFCSRISYATSAMGRLECFPCQDTRSTQAAAPMKGRARYCAIRLFSTLRGTYHTLLVYAQTGLRWWAQQDSNPQPTGYEPAALTFVLCAHMCPGGLLPPPGQVLYLRMIHPPFFRLFASLRNSQSIYYHYYLSGVFLAVSTLTADAVALGTCHRGVKTHHWVVASFVLSCPLPPFFRRSTASSISDRVNSPSSGTAASL